MSNEPVSNEPVSSARKPLISGNWKMNHNHFEAIQTIQKLAYALNPRDYDHVGRVGSSALHRLAFGAGRSCKPTTYLSRWVRRMCIWRAMGRSPARSLRPCWQSSTSSM